jgi:ribonucleotide monophosphatase NagD (HAD superfamily)
MTRTKNTLIDKDGVFVSGRAMIPGADSFLERLGSVRLSIWFRPTTPSIPRATWLIA